MFTFSCLPVSQSGCSSVCPSHNNYKHFTNFCRRIKRACNKTGIIPSRSRFGVAVLIICISSDDAVYLNHLWQSDNSSRLIHRHRKRGGRPPNNFEEGPTNPLAPPIIHPHFPSMSM